MEKKKRNNLQNDLHLLTKDLSARSCSTIIWFSCCISLKAVPNDSLGYGWVPQDLH